jgi:hypothetical protein
MDKKKELSTKPQNVLRRKQREAAKLSLSEITKVLCALEEAQHYSCRYRAALDITSKELDETKVLAARYVRAFNRAVSKINVATREELLRD